MRPAAPRGASSRLPRRRVAVLLVMVLLCGGVLTAWKHTGSTRLTLYFTSTQGLHPGDEVRVLGVKVGKVEAIAPGGDQVAVQVSVSGTSVPTGARAVILAPTLVGGRYVQLSPGYDGGPALADGDVIGLDRTAVPVEWDQIRTQLIGLTTALGPTKDDADGALGIALSGARRALVGNGANLGRSVEAAARAASTIAAGSEDFLSTLKNLNTLMVAINQSDADVVAFARELAAVSDLLEENRGRVRDLLTQVSQVMKVLRAYIRKNRAALTTTVQRTRALLDTLQGLEVELANILHLAPTTLANFYNIYDPSTGAFTGRPALVQGAGLSNLACQAIYSAGGTLDDCKGALGAVLDQLPIGDLPIGLLGPVQGGASNQQRERTSR